MADTGPKNELELLFFDTFSHENAEELNLDLVQFPRPVLIQEVRIIPLQTKVQADVPGGVRLGATNPSSFSLELYVNNLNRPNAATFEKLGIINYKENVDIQMKTDAEVPTDGLILKGWYNTLTVAIYGSLTVVKPETLSPPPPPPPQPRAKQAVDARSSQASEPTGRTEWEPPRQGSKPQQQHPLDYINQQVQAAQAAAQAAQAHIPSSQGIPPSQAHIPPGILQSGVPPAKTDMYSEQFHQQAAHRPDFMASPNMGMEARDAHYDPRGEPRQGKDGQFGSKSYEEGDLRGGSRERETSRDRDVRSRDVERDHKQKEWERFRERERERSREKERDFIEPEARDYPRSPSRRRSWSRSQSRSRSRSYSRSPRRTNSRSPRRSASRSPRRSVRSLSHSPRSYSRSPQGRSRSPQRRSRSPIRSRSRTPIRSRSRSYTPERQKIVPPRSPVQTPLSPRSQPLELESPIRPIPRHPRDPSPQFFREPSPTQEEIMEEVEVIDQIGDDTLFEPLSPDAVGYSDQDDLQDADRDYESISSGDELPNMDEIDPELQDFEEIDESCTFPTIFNPFTKECTRLLTCPDVYLTDYEQEKQILENFPEGPKECPPEAKLILSIIDQFSGTDHHDKWVTALEELPINFPKGLSWLLIKEKRTDVLDTLIGWVLEGLDEEKAMNQPESAFKVRHLKMGITLAGALCACDSDICVQALEKEVQSKLVCLMESPFMSYSLKVQIIRSLDMTTFFVDGIQWLLGSHSKQLIKAENAQSNCLQRILSLMLKKQNIRVIVALSALIRKINSFEVLVKMRKEVTSIMKTTFKEETKEENSGSTTDQEGVTESGDIREVTIDSVISCMKEATKLIRIAPHIIAQPSRSLPGKAMFTKKPPAIDPYPGLYHMIKNCGTLECVFHLLCNPTTFAQPQLFAAVEGLIRSLLQTLHGLRFLFSRKDTTNGIIRCLLQDDGQDEGEENPIQHLGVEMVIYLRTLQCIDLIRKFLDKASEKQENTEIIPTLHELYTITFTPQGRQAAIQVICMEQNLETLLQLVEKKGEEDKDKRKKSVVVAYTMSLLLTVVRHSTDMGVMERFGPRLVALSEEDFSSKLLEMQEWLLPLKTVTDLTQDGAGALVGHLKQYTEDLQKVPRGLITTMRILRYISIAPENPYPDEVSEELKYNYALVEMYGLDCLSICTTILQKVSEILLRPWQRGIPQSSEQITYHLSVVRPTLEIVQHTLRYLIKARATEFKDLTALPVLFELHTVLCSVPLSSNHMEELQEIQAMILGSLLAYTQPLPAQAETDEALSESLWTKTLKELLKYTIKAPYTYLSGLLILSEMLPLPLPIQTREPLTEEEVSVTVNNRKLWSVHLHCLSQQVQEMIRILATSTCQPLQLVLRRVCWQLSDLSSASAIMVARCILDMVVESFATLRRPTEKKDEGETTDDRLERIASPYASKMLNLLAYVLSQPSVKCAALQLMTQNSEDMDTAKYAELLPQMLEILNTVCETNPHVNSQECIVSIIQSLCDPEVALVMGENISIQDQIACALPSGNYMTQITTALLDHMGSADHSYASILPCVRTLVMLTEHDYGFYYLKSVLEQKTTAIGRLMVRINTTFSKDSSDCLSTLSTLLEFLRLLMTVEQPMDDQAPPRSFTLSQQELQEVLSWNPSMENHPLLDLEKLVEESAKDEETLESLYESMTGLMKMLRDSEGKEKKVLTEPPASQESLGNLYSKRAVYTVTGVEDDRLNPDYWLSNPSLDVADIEPDLTMADMQEMCRKYCPEFNLEEELKKTVITSQAEVTKPRRIKIGDRRKSQEISIYRGRGGKRPFVAPMRGRGIARGMMGASGRMDSFRTRTPNTSRPPSMHVDDFMKLEKGQDEINSNAVLPIRRVDSLVQRDGTRNTGRGRGGNFDRGSNRGNRGRSSFFTPPANYARRESNNIYVGGGGVNAISTSGGNRGDYINSRPKQSFESFGRILQHPASAERPMNTVRDFRFAAQDSSGLYHTRDPNQQTGRFLGDFRGPRDNSDRGRHARSFTK
ncbi:protein virilizer homolog isoform X3 [Crassostrea virginica]